MSNWSHTPGIATSGPGLPLPPPVTLIWAHEMYHCAPPYDPAAMNQSRHEITDSSGPTLLTVQRDVLDAHQVLAARQAVWQLERDGRSVVRGPRNRGAAVGHSGDLVHLEPDGAGAVCGGSVGHFCHVHVRDTWVVDRATIRRACQYTLIPATVSAALTLFNRARTSVNQ